MTSTDPVEQFVAAWVSRNVHNIPGLHDSEGLEHEITRLKANIIADASVRGISADSLEAVMGDFEDYLTNAYENVHDPDAGFQ